MSKYVFGPAPSRRLGRSLGIDLVPHEDVSFERMLAGLADFRREFRGDYWLEVFVLGAYTAIKAEGRLHYRAMQ